ncbi:MAG: hypothetical protein H8D84_02855 [Proteobacteria bacterium]|nr:hypothetical protein [Pseudomonadota bacterium]
MAYTGTIPAGGHGNYVSPNTAHEGEGVQVDFITVDLLATATGEVTHPYASANTAGLHMIREAFENNGVNILGNGVITAAHEHTFMVRRDSLDTISSTTTVAAIQAAIRALNSNSKITLTISSATAADRDMGKLTAMA